MIHYSKRHLKEKGIFLNCDELFFKIADWCISILAVSLSDFLPRRSAVARLSSCCVFLIVGIHASGISIPLSPLIFLGWSLMSIASDPARVVPRVTINELYFVPEWLVSGVVGMLWNGGGLGTGESNVSIVLLNSVLHRSSSLSDVHLAAFTGNPVNYAILFSRVDSVLWWY